MVSGNLKSELLFGKRWRPVNTIVMAVTITVVILFIIVSAILFSAVFRKTPCVVVSGDNGDSYHNKIQNNGISHLCHFWVDEKSSIKCLWQDSTTPQNINEKTAGFVEVGISSVYKFKLDSGPFRMIEGHVGDKGTYIGISDNVICHQSTTRNELEHIKKQNLKTPSCIGETITNSKADFSTTLPKERCHYEHDMNSKSIKSMKFENTVTSAKNHAFYATEMSDGRVFYTILHLTGSSTILNKRIDLPRRDSAKLHIFHKATLTAVDAVEFWKSKKESAAHLAKVLR